MHIVWLEGGAVGSKLVSISSTHDSSIIIEYLRLEGTHKYHQVQHPIPHSTS